MVRLFDPLVFRVNRSQHRAKDIVALGPAREEHYRLTDGDAVAWPHQ